jgi:hypothetical protein
VSSCHLPCHRRHWAAPVGCSQAGTSGCSCRQAARVGCRTQGRHLASLVHLHTLRCTPIINMHYQGMPGMWRSNLHYCTPGINFEYPTPETIQWSMISCRVHQLACKPVAQRSEVVFKCILHRRCA